MHVALGSVSAALLLSWHLLPSPREALDVVLPPLMTTCSCLATVTPNPQNGAVKCPDQSTGCQIVWTDFAPTNGLCGYDAPACVTVPESKCSVNVPALRLNLMSCWANGVWMTATGLQNGQRFWHEDGDGISFEPGGMEAACETGGPHSEDTGSSSSRRDWRVCYCHLHHHAHLCEVRHRCLGPTMPDLMLDQWLVAARTEWRCPIAP